MVASQSLRYFWTSGVLVFSASVFASSSVLRMELHPSEFYEGQQISCRIILESPLEALELEVVKFPEFRGFWSQNTILRQGPLMMAALDPFQQRRGLLIGGYELTPMVGYPTKILPMRAVLREMGIGGETQLVSSPPEFRVKPLPPIPPDLSPYWSGAVGRFELEPSQEDVETRPGEPAALRYVLRGEGNFQSINALKVPLPAGTEVLREDARQETIPWPHKAFELTARLPPGTSSIPEWTWVYFDPQVARYVPITVRPLPVLGRLPPAEKKGAASSLAQSESLRHPIGTEVLFWLVQAILAGVWLWQWRKAYLRYLLARGLVAGQGARQNARKDALVSLQNRDWKMFFYSFKLAWLRRFLPGIGGHAWRVALPKAKLSGDVRTALTEVLVAEEKLRFHPDHPEPVVQELTRTVGALEAGAKTQKSTPP